MRITMCNLKNIHIKQLGFLITYIEPSKPLVSNRLECPTEFQLLNKMTSVDAALCRVVISWTCLIQ